MCREHVFINADEVTTPTPHVDGNHARKRKFRCEDFLFDSIDHRRRDDEYMYQLIVKTFKPADWQLRFQQKVTDENRGASVYSF